MFKFTFMIAHLRLKIAEKWKKFTLQTFINALLQKTLITNVYKLLSKKIACDSEA